MYIPFIVVYIALPVKLIVVVKLIAVTAINNYSNIDE